MAFFAALGFFGFLLAAFPAAAQPASQAPQPAAPDPSTPLAEQLQKQLEPYRLRPILVPRGEQVGDVYDASTSILLAASQDCFPRLAPRRTPGQLPGAVTENASGLAAALGVSGPVGAEIGGGDGNRWRFELSFRDVEASLASVVQLRQGLQRGIAECDALRPYLESLEAAGARPGGRRIAAAPASGPPPLLLGTVFLARRVLRVSLDSQRSAAARLSLPQALLNLLGAQFQAKAGAGRSESNMWEFVGNQVIPVAFAPAFVPVVFRNRGNGEALAIVHEVDLGDSPLLLPEGVPGTGGP